MTTGMEWASLLPSAPSVAPVPPKWDRPQFDHAGAMQAAQKYLLTKQAYETAAAEAPYRLKTLQNEVAQQPTQNAMLANRAEILQRENSRGAATYEPQVAADTATAQATVATKAQEMSDAQLKKLWLESQIFDKSASFLESKTSAEFSSAIDATLKQLRAMNFSEESILQFQDGISDPAYRKNLHDQAASVDTIVRQRAAMNYGATSVAGQSHREVVAINGANALVRQALENQPDLTPQQQTDIWNRAYYRSLGVPEPTAADAPPPPAAAPSSIATDAKKAKEIVNPAKRSPEVERTIKANPQAAHYDGSPDDENAQLEWLKSLDNGAAFISPDDGTIKYKRAPKGSL